MSSGITQSPCSPADTTITLVNGTDEEPDKSSIYPEIESEERPKKRRKTHAGVSEAKKTRKTRGGKLRDLPTMPLDILFDIFCLLLPLDILNLSRATKSLRNILMHSSAAFVWKDAFSNLRITPPPRPSTMTEPQWASLLFDSYCQFCLAFGVHKPTWAFNIRACKDCLRNRTISSMSLPRRTTEILRDAAGLTGGWMFNLIPSVINGADFSFKLDDIQDFTKQYSNAINKRAFLQERNKLNVENDDHCKRCITWQEEIKQERADELENLREKRKTAIFARLEDLDWGDEIQKLNKWDPTLLAHHPSIKQAKNLTDRIWSNIKPALILFLEIQKTERLKRERAALIKERLRIFISVMDHLVYQHRPQIIPPVRDMYEMDGVKSTINEDTTVTSASFKTIIESQLSGFIKEWRQAKDIGLLSLIPKTSTKSASLQEPQLSELSLATIFFQCKVCQKAISYPRILVHDCTIQRLCSSTLEERVDIFLSMHSTPSNLDNVTFDCSAHANARKVVRICGLNPETATTTAMNDENFWIESALPSRTYARNRRAVMTWSTAVTFASSHPSSLMRLMDTHQYTPLTKELEKNGLKVRRGGLTCCEKCGAACSPTYLPEHLKEHGLSVDEDTLVEGEHYYILIDTPSPAPFIFTDGTIRY